MRLLPVITISLLLLTLTGTIKAQYNTAGDSDQKALEILESISRDYQKASSHQIDFTLEMEFPGQGMESQSGVLSQSGEKFRMDMDQHLIISDTKSVWMYMREMNEAQINDADFSDNDEFMSPSDLFNLYESEEFVFAITNYGSEEGKEVLEIEAKPLDPASDFSKMRLTVFSKSHAVNKLKIFNKDGSRFTMKINKHIKNLELPNSTFTFDESDFPGVHIEDLRF